MAENLETLKFALMIDGKEAIAEIKLTKEQLEALQQGLTGVEEGATTSFNEIIKKLYEYDDVTAENIESITEWLKTQEVTEEALDTVIAGLEAQSRQLDINSDHWRANQIATTNLRSAYSNLVQENLSLSTAQTQTTDRSRNMDMAVNKMGFAVRAAQGSLMGLRTGINGIVSNMPRAVELFKEASEEAKGMGMSVKDVLIKSLTGAGGLILAINGVMLLMQVLPQLFRDATEEAEKFESAVDGVINNLIRLKDPMEGLQFQINPDDIDKLLSDIDNRIKLAEEINKIILSNAGISVHGINVGAILAQVGVTEGLGEEEKKRLVTNEKLSDKLKEMKATLEAQKIVQEVMDANDIKASQKKEEKEKKTKELTEEQKKRIDFLFGTISLEEYKKYLEDRLATLTGANIKEKQLVISLRDELKQLNETYKLPEIKMADKLDEPEPLKDLKYGDVLKYARLTGQQELDEWKKKEDEKAKTLENSTEILLAIQEEYYRRQNDLDTENLMKKLDVFSTIADAWQQALNTMYNMAQQNAMDDITQWKNKEQAKIDSEREAALTHARSQEARQRINERFDKKQQQLEDDANKRAHDKLIVWLRLKQLGDIAAATMTTYSAATSALKEPPVGLGPVFGWPLMVATIAAGLANVAMITRQKIPGFEKGGIVVGEKGPEIIAPFQEYASGQAKLISMTMMTLRDELRHPVVNSTSNDDLLSINNELKDLLKAIKSEGITARAYLDDREAKRITSRGNFLNNKSRL